MIERLQNPGLLERSELNGLKLSREIDLLNDHLRVGLRVPAEEGPTERAFADLANALIANHW
jgi:hypothetical protein